MVSGHPRVFSLPSFPRILPYFHLPDPALHQATKFSRTSTMGAVSAILVVLITILFPPVGVWTVAGCGADLFINICLTILGYIPGHIHAFYIEYVYYDRREQAREGRIATQRAPGVYSDRVQSGGANYGTMTQPTH
ncbi:hypothetical protein F4809DRAFT_635273 [Biscogniauxia mediterranea]|nr:hypothetical protein F4809DRAFT_635273 [Biscogniauxia mediterranea]